MLLARTSKFSGKKKIFHCKHSRLKNLKWQEANHLVIYKDDRRAVSTEKQLQFNAQGMTWARDLRISGVSYNWLRCFKAKDGTILYKQTKVYLLP